MSYVNYKFLSYVNCKNISKNDFMCYANHGTNNMTKLKF